MAAIGEVQLLDVAMETLDVVEALEVVLWLRESLSLMATMSKTKQARCSMVSNTNCCNRTWKH
jgi:hypothetical protein